jgi:hypothetical protein
MMPEIVDEERAMGCFEKIDAMVKEFGATQEHKMRVACGQPEDDDDDDEDEEDDDDDDDGEEWKKGDAP